MPAQLHVIAGPMFSGKTERLIAYIRRAQYGKRRVKILTPAVDTRSSKTIAARAIQKNGKTKITGELPAIPIRNEQELKRELAKDDYDVLGIDEAQFFPGADKKDGLGWVGRAVRDLLRRRKDDQIRIFVSGLDLDAFEKPFGAMPGLLSLADTVEKLSAVCMLCGANDAHFSQRIGKRVKKGKIAVGDIDEYKAVCRACYDAS
jgi:thymidine kinase